VEELAEREQEVSLATSTNGVLDYLKHSPSLSSYCK